MPKSTISTQDEVCICGDPRLDHPNDGPCKYNKTWGHYIPDKKLNICERYRPLEEKAKA